VAYSDWRSVRIADAIQEEGRLVLQELELPIQLLKRVLSDEQVQSLAVRAVEKPETTGDLRSYVNGRVSQISDVQVFDRDVSELQPTSLGPNGFALYEMILSALEGKQSLLQIHQVLQPVQMFDAVAISSGGEVLGVLVVQLDPQFLLGGFNPEYSSLGVVRLVQYNGRQPQNVLANFGDSTLLGEVPERIAVPGTLFRLEFPRVQRVQLASGGMLLILFLVGLVCLVVSAFLYQANKKWSKQQQIEEATEKRSKSVSPRLVADPEPPSLPASGEPATASITDTTAQESQRASGTAVPEPPPMHLHYDIAERRKTREAQHAPVELSGEIFRAYDIRGVIDKTLDSGVAKSVGQAVGSLALERDASPVVVARDGRLSGPYLMEGMIEGIVSTGCDVLDIGAMPTGVLYYAAHEMGAGSGVMITGSHNPPDYNGFKVMVAGDTLHGEAITGLYERIKAGNLKTGQGKVTQKDVVQDYIQRIASDITVEKPMRVVIDCGNGIGGVCAADTLRAIGVEVLPLFDEVDGTFPNHHPDPSEPENLVDLIESVRLMDADLGLAFDGDADRLGVVTLAGNIIFPDRVMMLLALDVLDRNPGATIIYDVKCTQHLPAVIREAGGNPVMYKTGHSLIKARMKEIGSPFAGEMSGHFFFGERWYGVDDGIYAAARLLEILGGTETPPEAILNALPSSYSTPELKVQMEEGQNHQFVEVFQLKANFADAEINTIDGLRADFSDGWGLVRASNTTPILVVRFDAESEQALERIKSVFRTQMLEINPDLELPF
jgi:phosphomannomutase